jgi:hypothetical protein
MISTEPPSNEHKCVCGSSFKDEDVLSSHVAIMNGVQGKIHAPVIP